MEEFSAQQRGRRALMHVDYEHRRFDQPKACAIESCGKCDKVFQCGRCKRRYYCSKEHQMADWKVHKKYCKVFVEFPVLSIEQRTHTALSETERMVTAQEFVRQFIRAFYQDSYCSNDDVDGVFGWQVSEEHDAVIVDGDFPIGRLMRNAWNYIIKRSNKDLQEWQEILVDLLLKGEMVQYFREQAYAMKDTCSYCRELYFREYKGIPWNQSGHLMLAGESY